MKSKQRIDIDQLQTGFDRGFDALDELRSTHLDESLKLRSAKEQMYQREYNRLANKYGELHPRVLEVKGRIEISGEQFKSILAERKIPLTSTDPGGGVADKEHQYNDPKVADTETVKRDETKKIDPDNTEKA